MNNQPFVNALFKLLESILDSEPPEATRLKVTVCKLFENWGKGGLNIKKTRANQITGSKTGRFKNINPFVLTPTRLNLAGPQPNQAAPGNNRRIVSEDTASDTSDSDESDGGGDVAMTLEEGDTVARALINRPETPIGSQQQSHGETQVDGDYKMAWKLIDIVDAAPVIVDADLESDAEMELVPINPTTVELTADIALIQAGNQLLGADKELNRAFTNTAIAMFKFHEAHQAAVMKRIVDLGLSEKDARKNVKDMLELKFTPEKYKNWVMRGTKMKSIVDVFGHDVMNKQIPWTKFYDAPKKVLNHMTIIYNERQPGINSSMPRPESEPESDNEDPMGTIQDLEE